MPLLFGVVLLDMIGFGIVIPILPFLSPTLGAGKLDIAMIIASYAVCAGLCGPFWGRLSDRIGRGERALLTHFGYRTAWLCFAVVVAVNFCWTLAQPREDDHPHPA